MRRIRLTESQLHRVIKESVSRLLTELDWRTYQSAYEKERNMTPDQIAAYDQKHGQWAHAQRMSKFKQASENAFNNQNGYNVQKRYGDDGSYSDVVDKNKPFYGGYDGIVSDNGGNPVSAFSTRSATIKNPNNRNSGLYWHNKQNVVSEPDYNHKRGENFNNDDSDIGEREQDNAYKQSYNPMLKAAQMRGDSQVRNYFNGNSQYRNGKWQ